jgi:hypothetical protein
MSMEDLCGNYQCSAGIGMVPESGVQYSSGKLPKSKRFIANIFSTKTFRKSPLYVQRGKEA